MICSRPFLRWVGGKTQLLPELLKRVPSTFGSYREPFVGGGSLFFAMQQKRAFLSDVNAELATTYLEIRDLVERLCEGPYVELFGRKPRVGLTVLGDQMPGTG